MSVEKNSTKKSERPAATPDADAAPETPRDGPQRVSSEPNEGRHLMPRPTPYARQVMADAIRIANAKLAAHFAENPPADEA